MRPAASTSASRAFEKTPLPDNWFDLVIGNVPFGKYKVADLSNRAYARFSIHNYFFGRALDLVRPGGLVCFITTSYTMDALDDAARVHRRAGPPAGRHPVAPGHLCRHRVHRRADRHPVPAQAAAGGSGWQRVAEAVHRAGCPAPSALPRAVPADQCLVRPAPGVLHRQHPEREQWPRSRWRRPCSKATWPPSLHGANRPAADGRVPRGGRRQERGAHDGASHQWRQARQPPPSPWAGASRRGCRDGRCA
jgi:hypothetical protein